MSMQTKLYEVTFKAKEGKVRKSKSLRIRGVNTIIKSMYAEIDGNDVDVAPLWAIVDKNNRTMFEIKYSDFERCIVIESDMELADVRNITG